MDPVQSVPPPQPKKDYTLVVILSITTLLGVLIAIFFYVQNQELRKLIAVSPSPTPLASPAPSATPNLITDWETHTSDKYKYTFKLPSDWLEMFLNGKKGDENTLEVTSRNKDNDTKITFFVEKLGTQKEGSEKYTFSDGTTGTRETTNPGGGISHDVVTVKSKSYDYVIDFEFKTMDAANAKTLFDQILSTFKFTDSQSTPSATPN